MAQGRGYRGDDREDYDTDDNRFGERGGRFDQGMERGRQGGYGDQRGYGHHRGETFSRGGDYSNWQGRGDQEWRGGEPHYDRQRRYDERAGRDDDYGDRQNSFGKQDHQRGSFGSSGHSGWSEYGDQTGNRGRRSGGGGGYGGGRGDQLGGSRAYGGGERGYAEGGRSFLDKAADTVSSWFGDEDAESRREQDRHRGRGPKSYTRSDDRIREDLNDRLTDDGSLDASDIDVQVSNREVTLSGEVSSRWDKRRAEDIAESVSGVTHVQNNLRVRQSGSGGRAPSAGTALSSTEMTAAQPGATTLSGDNTDSLGGGRK